MAPQGPGRFGKSVNAWLFKASCDSGTHSVEIRVHDAFAESEAASAAEKYGKDIGRLPKVLRTGIKPAKGFQILSIHKGNYSWSANSSDGKVNIYTGFGRDGHDEEVLFHEATHVSLDKRIEPDGAWEAAQKADRAFISHHAENLPSREDVAESFLAYFSARFVRSRITKKWEKTIYETIPNRIAYFDALLSANDMTPFTKASPRVAGLVIKYDSLAIEASNTATYDIRLFSPPDAVVTVTPASDDAAVATVSGPLTFTTGNWHIPQTVTVTGTGPGTATISHTSSSNYAATALPVPVTVLQTVSLSVSGNGAVDEGDPALTVTATLRAANATGQALAIPVQARAAGTTATSADYTLAGTISIAAGAISGTTDLAVVDDGNDELEETLVIELGSPLPSGLAAGEMDHVTITISDNDVTTVTLTTRATAAGVFRRIGDRHALTPSSL